MMTPQALSSNRPTPLRDLAYLAGIAGVAVAVGLFTPLFDYAFQWTQPLGTPATRTGVLVIVLLAALWFLWRRKTRAQEAAPPQATDRETDPAAPTAFPDPNPHPILEVGTDGVIYYMNHAARTLFPDLSAYGPAHLVLHDLQDFVAGLRDGTAVRAVREVQIDDAVYEQQAACVPDSDHVRLYLHDITRRKRTQEALRKSEAKFERAFRSAPMAISINRLSDGRFVDVNDHFLRLLGFKDRSEVTERTATELDIWAYRGNRAYVLDLLAQDDQAAHRYETQIYTTDGRVRDVSVSVVVMEANDEACVLSALLDVTEHRQAEAGLGMLKAFYENTLRDLPIQVAVLDDEARFIYLNPAAMQNEEMRLWMAGKTSVDFARACGYDPAPYEKRHQWLLNVIARKEMGQLEEILTTHTGEERHMLRVAMPVLDEDDEVIYVVGYGIDMTERKAFEQQLVEAKRAAEEVARLKSSFVANMSHEVRTPLTAILGFATVLGEELEAEQRELADIIKQSGERLLETLNSVLDLARLEANAIEVDPRLLNLGDEVEAAARLFTPMAESKGLAFRLDMPDEKVRAQLDRAFLHRILSNLLSNAIKFTEEGEVRLTLQKLENEVKIQVHDTGIGIEESFQPHLFDEFKQESTGLSRSHTGSGLGLAITRHLVEHMHGRIEVKSAKGAGTTFTVTFPALRTPLDLLGADLMDMDQLDLFSETDTPETAPLSDQEDA